MRRFAQGGFTWIREDFPWATLEPSPGIFSWTRADNLMSAAASNNIQVLAVIDYATPWDSTCAPAITLDNQNCPPSNISDYATYAVDVLQRYGPNGSFWATHPSLPPDPITATEVWNEAWGNWDWYPEPDAAGYAAMLVATATAIHASFPQVRVLANANEVELRLDSVNINWIQALHVADPTIDMVFNGWSVHPYPWPATTPPTTCGTPDVDDFCRVLTIHREDPLRPIWITEIGWSTCSDPTQCVSQATQATYDRDAAIYAMLYWRSFVRHFFVFSLDSDYGPANASSVQGFYGLRNSDDSFKPAWYTVVGLIQNGT